MPFGPAIERGIESHADVEHAVPTGAQHDAEDVLPLVQAEMLQDCERAGEVHASDGW